MMPDEIDVHEAFSGDMARFNRFWESQRQQEEVMPRTLARIAWQESQRYLPCGHPAGCGEPCGWCAGVRHLNAAYSDVLHAYSCVFPEFAFAGIREALLRMAEEIQSLRLKQQEPRP